MAWYKFSMKIELDMVLTKCRKVPTPDSLLRLKKELIRHLPVFRQYYLSRGRTVTPVGINLEGVKKHKKKDTNLSKFSAWYEKYLEGKELK